MGGVVPGAPIQRKRDVRLENVIGIIANAVGLSVQRLEYQEGS
tara:strand:- start:329 stop:457 length:129 start_codon:yes stop_codon:yes gene_type:complete